MEFIKANYLNTTTQLILGSNTSTASNLFNPDKYYQYVTDGMNSDLTLTSITVNMEATSTVSRIVLVDTNLKKFTIFYNGSTANTFSMTNTGSTTTSAWTTNTQSNMYLRCNTQTAITSITIDMYTTIVADQEKRVGFLMISDLYFAMTQFPSANNYDPIIKQKQVVHQLSDGGTRVHKVRQKWNTNISLEYVTTSDRDSLYSIYSLLTPFAFCPFGTSTSWDAAVFECVWDGNFDFYQFSTNAQSSGFSGKITLKETST